MRGAHAGALGGALWVLHEGPEELHEVPRVAADGTRGHGVGAILQEVGPRHSFYGPEGQSVGFRLMRPANSFFDCEFGGCGITISREEHFDKPY